MPSRSIDERWMRLALALGARGLGRVWPNPSVGCVIVKDGIVLGRGWTQPTGRPHGEVVALAQAGVAARGATAYVTLEPCAHHGKTPPCSQALINAGIKRVVCATQDPDERVSGKGFQMLRDAGITVDIGCLKDQANAAHIGFFMRITNGRPMVTLKLANSIDGRIATRTGESRWISNAQSRAYVHMLRATHDGVMVGRGTSLADNPDLRVRTVGLGDRNPVRIVLDSNLKTPTDSRLSQTANDTPVWLCHGKNADTAAWADNAASLIKCNYAPQGLDLYDVLKQLGQRGLTRIFCEGGGTLAAALLRANLVDQLITFQAGVAIGGDGTASLASMGVEKLSDAPRFALQSMQNFDGDVMATWSRS
ncbi:riboflavin biosynthesis protein RibD [Amylibacter ulvae]|uniref:Riboflavin biosynthesis protein RibD n=1 Tax=Paramylibacter ulvae TaxID=1651968 RepID=A0ABQ3D1R8_9RHOB|nr:bifunctional diaminohydroxyphosphoribosylaminopyrimidine deaminase/5-amino-6-(5-phosphoribosylamino)uracil reductase RibD [Amylibacter ulvae]GHA54254.1 riboflavin biosynthesis protein RibD [Amylibacter ulvae]